MNKKEFIDAIAASHDALPRTEINRIVGTIIDTIGNEIKRGRTVQITGFGTFSTVRRKARKGRNPKTGEPIKIAAMTLPKFSAGKTLKDRVSKKSDGGFVISGLVGDGGRWACDRPISLSRRKAAP